MTTRPREAQYATCLTNIHDRLLEVGVCPTGTSIGHAEAIAELYAIKKRIEVCFRLALLPHVDQTLLPDTTHGSWPPN